MAIVILNPSDRDWKRHRYVLWFGACGSTRIMVWANGLEDALEECAAYLADHAPGHIMAEWSDEHEKLIAEVCEERGVAFPDGFQALKDDAKWEICTAAEADLTRTESGFITSYEWGIYAEDPERGEVCEMIADCGGVVLP
jgi:hypothetical protein